MTGDDGDRPLTHAVLTFFNDHEARTVDALAARTLPGDADDPGAREAGAVLYIDRALTGAYAEHRLLYRRGVDELDELSDERHGLPFVQLDERQQDALLSRLCDPQAPLVRGEHGHGPAASPAAARGERLTYFFAVVREHVIQGTFCDPVYGGNRDGVGWRLLGFPGAYWGYDGTQHGQLGFDASKLPIKTLADLRRERDGHLGQESVR